VADDSPKNAINGLLGHLPPWPRKALNSSVVAMEQAYRQRKGLPLLSAEAIRALKAGEPMPWEFGNAASLETSQASAPTGSITLRPAATVAAPVLLASPETGRVAPSAGISEEVRKLVLEGRKWSKSAIAAEQARRGRKALPPLNDAEVTALLGESATAAAAVAPASAGATAASAPRVAAAAPTATASVARSGEWTKYVGTPAVAPGVASIGPKDNEINRQRRRLVWATVAAFLTAWFVAFFRFFLPRTLFEPATTFKIGYPEEYGLGVDTKYQQKYRIWVVRTPDRIFVIYARCTHLGCTPDWKPGENKFKCPCHGSGYDSEGVNFEGPAPRPMDRAHVERSADGQILVDVSRLYRWPKSQPSQFNDDGAYLPA